MILQNYKKSCSLLLKNYLKLPLLMLLDLLTIFIINFLALYFSQFLNLHLQDFLTTALKTQGQNSIFPVILGYIAFYLSVLLVYLLFQPLAWHITLRICKKKLALKNFIIKTLLFFIIFAVINTIHDTLLLFNRLRPYTIFNKTILDSVVYAIYLALAYFIIVSYSTKLTFRKSFISAMKKGKIYIQAYALIIVTFILIHYFMDLFRNYQWMIVLLGILLFLPAISFARIYMIKTEVE